MDSKDSLAQLEASRSSTKDLFKDLLNEVKGFKYQIATTVLLCKRKEIRDIEYAPVYFSTATKTAINFRKYDLDKSFQEILYRTENWINEGSGWLSESIEAQYVNISIYSPFIGSTYIELPDKLNGLINIENNNNQCFLWRHIRHLNPLNMHPERITKEVKKIINDHNYEGIKFTVSKRIIAQLNHKIAFTLMYSVMKIISLILLIYQIKNLKIIWICC